jgi:arylsulfatase A-like enzyme
VLLVAAALFQTACSCNGEGEGGEPVLGPGSGDLNLLLRGADVVIEEPGELVPEPRAEWGVYGGGGWLESNEPKTTADGRLYVETNQPVASLRLPATGRAARTLAVELWRTKSAPGTTGTALVRLNGLEIKELVLGDAPDTYEIHTDAALWHEGDNVLEFEAPLAGLSGPVGPESAATSGPPRWDTLAVSRVVYGTPRPASFDRERKRYSLPTGTGLVHVVEVAEGSRLFLRGESAGPGELSLRVERVDPRNGDPSPAGDPLLFASRGPLDRALVLPDPQGRLLSIELQWRSEEDATFELAELWIEEPRPAARPPILFISIDTLAARHLSLYGYSRATTPHLEALARDAVVFERCVANAPWTLPSYLSVMTGLYPSAHLVQDLATGADAKLDNFDYWQIAPSRWTLAEALRARGYQTAGAVDSDWLSTRFRFDQGFDFYDDSAKGIDFRDPRGGIEYLADHFPRWLDGERDPRAPFFVFVHALDAHGPYLPEPPYLDRFAADLPADRRPAPAGAVPYTYGQIPDWMAWTLVAKDEPFPSSLPVEEIVARYDEAILKTDAGIERFLDIVRERGLYDDAVIVVTGDHGESFSHDFYSHGCLWEDVVHVPLIVKLPRNAHAGARVASSVQLVDLYPTLLELAGAEAARPWLHGTSLLRSIADPELPPRATYSEEGHIAQAMIELDGLKLVELEPGLRAGVPQLLTHPRAPRAWIERNFPELTGEVLDEELRRAIEGRADFARLFQELQGLVRGPYYELYDLRSDPGELHDLAAERPEDVARLKALLDAERARAAEARAEARPIRTRTFDPAELERLKELGYGGDEKGGSSRPR